PAEAGLPLLPALAEPQPELVVRLPGRIRAVPARDGPGHLQLHQARPRRRRGPPVPQDRLPSDERTDPVRDLPTGASAEAAGRRAVSDEPMNKTKPTALQIAAIAGFVLSCFGLALYLWISFGGPTPLAPRDYQIKVPFT